MAGIKISELPRHPLPISYDDLIPIVHGSTGSALLTTYHVSASEFVINPVFYAVGITLPSTSPAFATLNMTAPFVYTLSLGIPSGAPGPTGSNGARGFTPRVSATAVTVDYTQPATVDTTGTINLPIFNFSIPRGIPGAPGVGINFKGQVFTHLDLTNVVSPTAGDAWIVQVDENFSPALSGVFYVYGTLPGGGDGWILGGSLQGPTGAPGLAATIATVSAVSATFGTAPSVANYGTINRADLLFTIPQGPQGIQGDWSAPQTMKYLSGSNYTVTSADAGSLIIIESDAPSIASFTLSPPIASNNNFAIGQKVDFIRTGTSQVSCASAIGCTVNGTPSLILRDQWSSASLIHYKQNKWIVIGDLASII